VGSTGIYASFYNPLGLAFDPGRALMLIHNSSGKMRKIIFQLNVSQIEILISL